MASQPRLQSLAADPPGQVERGVNAARRQPSRCNDADEARLRASAPKGSPTMALLTVCARCKQQKLPDAECVETSMPMPRACHGCGRTLTAATGYHVVRETWVASAHPTLETR